MIIFHDLNYFSQIHNINILSESFFLFGIAKKMFHEINAKTPLKAVVLDVTASSGSWPLPPSNLNGGRGRGYLGGAFYQVGSRYRSQQSAMATELRLV